MFVFITFSSKASAANPTIINFQGKVVNSDGTNVANGSYNFDFVLYDDAALGSPSDGVHDKWHELSKSVTVTNGVFQTNLGSATSLSSVDFNAYPNLYLAVRFNADAAGYMTPRVQMSSVPYAFNADRVGGIAASGLVQLSPGAQQSGFINVSGDFTSGGNLAVTGTYNTNTFSGSALTFGAASTATIQSASSQALNIVGHAASTFSTDAGSLTIQGFAGATVRTPNATTATNNVSMLTGNATSSGNTGSISITTGDSTAATAGNITIDVGASGSGNGAIQIGTASRPQTVSIGNSNASSTVTLTAGGGISLASDTTISGTIAANGGSITTNQTTFNLANTTATTVNAFGAATAINIGANGATILGGGSLIIRSGGSGAGGTLVVGSSPQTASNTSSSLVLLGSGAVTGSGSSSSGIVRIDSGSSIFAATGDIEIGPNNSSNVKIGRTVGGGNVVLSGTVNINDYINNNVSINAQSSTGTITLGGGNAPLAINSTNFDVSTAGVLSGITGLDMASGNFLQNGSGTFGTGSGNVSLNGATSVTGSNTFSVAGGLATLSAGLTATGATNINTSGSASTTIGNASSTTTVNGTASFTATAPPTADQVTITNAGQAVATAGVNGLRIDYIGGAGAIESSAQHIDLTPGGTSGSTWSGLRIAANTTGAASGVNEYGLKLEGPSSPGAGNETAVDITTGWDIGIDISSGGLQLGDQAEPATPAAGNLKIYARSIAGRMLLRQKGPSGVATPLQPSFFQNAISICAPNSTTLATGITEYGTDCVGANNGTGTVTAINDEVFGSMYNYASATTIGNDIGFSTNTTQWFRGSAAGANGFFWNMRVGTVDSTSLRIFAGLSNQTLATMLGADNPAGHHAGFQFSTVRGDTNWMFSVKDNATQNAASTAMAYQTNKVYDLYMFVPPYPNNGTVYWRIENMTDNTTQEGSVTTNLPGGSTAMRSAFGVETRTGGARNIRWARMYIEADR